jgi:urea carboxylase
LRPKDRVRFRRLKPKEGADDCVLARIEAAQGRPEVVYRRAGDRNLLIEYGPEVLDLEMRFRVHALMQWLEDQSIAAIIDLTPGIRSLQIHFDSTMLSLMALLATLRSAEDELPPIEEIEVPTRIVHLPLSWDDPAIREAIAKYAQSVRNDAPWCPSNIEFIRRINGLEDVEEVRRIIFEASYVVLGLGDVYLGAPVATPLDPRHRLVTTKYNPARTWTPENAVGIGGAYMCVYGMEGPGGYQLFGRTCQMWNTYAAGDPWLLRFFDQIRFYPVSDQELLAFRDAFRHGRVALETSEAVFRLKDYRAFLGAHAPSIRAAKARQQAAFDAESARWKLAEETILAADLPAEPDAATGAIAPDAIGVQSPVAGSVWRILVKSEQTVMAGEILALVESMKMEIQVVAPADGIVDEIRCSEGRSVDLAQILMVLRP